MKKYTVIGQNVYEVKQARLLDMEEKILVCIAVNQDMAVEIAASLNVIASYQSPK